ncbi:MAG: cation:proton antiporter [Armatimonadota bacterium]|nr:cation:proton antiporter [Armatimonadota bacterium]
MRKATLLFILLAACILYPAPASAAAGNTGGAEVAQILLALVILLVAAKLGGSFVVRVGQPAVLGELVFGIIIGNLHLLGINSFEFIKTDETVRILSEIGVTLLLFQVGLESDLGKLMQVGTSSLLVATIGVVCPFALGFIASSAFMPHESIYVHLFVGATLCATSVGVTARVLMDLGWLKTTEARIILGAAVVDDVQGLIILAVVSGIIRAASAGGQAPSTWAIIWIIAKASLFLAGAVVIGRWIAPKVFHIASRLSASDLLLTTALAICFSFAYLASWIGLAPIVGAFAAGLILDEVHWRSFRERGEHSVEELIKPLTAFLVPVFFVVMGARVELKSFAHVEVLGLAGVVTLAAILGKLACGIGAIQKGLDRLSIGIGMIPRAEVGLIFASIGTRLRLHGEPVVSQSTLSVMIIMVILTTLITPIGLKWSIARSTRKKVKTEVASQK